MTPILVQMVKSANMNGLLDSDSDSLTDCQQKVKARLHEIMQKGQEFTEEDYRKVRGKGRIGGLVPRLPETVGRAPQVFTLEKVHLNFKEL